MDVKNVTAAKPGITGAIRTAPYGTALPTSAEEELPEVWKTLGYVSEDGYNNSNNSESTSTKGWGGNTIFEGETAKPDTFKTKLMEYLNPDVAAVVYGDDNVETYEDGSLKTIHANNTERERRSWVIDERLVDGRKSRTVIADGTVTTTEDIEHKDGAPMGYGITISAKPNPAHKNEKGVDDTHVTYFSRGGE